MNLRNPWWALLAGRAGAMVLRTWMGTVRYHIRAKGEHVDPSDANLPRRYIYSFWHEDMMFMVGGPWRPHKFCALISQSGDGEFMAQICQGLRVKLARGSSRRGGSQAMFEMLAHGPSLHFAVTPDGPRGPRRQVQPGVVYLASRIGLPIVPCGIAYQKAWRARSWDRFAVPLPFSGAFCVTGPLIHVPGGIGRDDIEIYRRQVQAHMLDVTADADAWVHGKAPPEAALPDLPRIAA